MQDVALEALTGIAAGDRVLREGAVVSLSAIPYGFDAIQNGDDDTTNRVSIGSDTEVTGGAFNELSYKVFAINNPDNMGSGANANIPLPAGCGSLDNPAVVTLTSQQKVTFGVDGHELDYEFAEVGVEGISLDASQGSTVIKLVKEDGTTSGTSPNAFAGGELGPSYLLRNVTGQTVQLQPHLVDFSDTSVWRKLNSRNSDDLAMINGTDDTVQNYNSNTVLDLADTLTNKFYVVKPVDSGLPQLRYTNIANNLIAQRNQLLSYMANHSSEPKSLARYQAQIDEIDRALDTYGLVTYETVGSDTIKVIKRDLDVLVLDLPGLYSGVGSVSYTCGR